MRQSNFPSHNVSFATETAAIVKQAQIYISEFLFVSLAMNVLNVVFQSRHVHYCFLSFSLPFPKTTCRVIHCLGNGLQARRASFLSIDQLFGRVEKQYKSKQSKILQGLLEWEL